ncbi:MAG: type II toxin-antitoxin system HicA family toxin [Nitrospiria bacterium]
MKLPRDLSADAVSKHLARYGYTVTRQTGSHLRLTTKQGEEHHVTIPSPGPLRVGTLNAILTDVASHLKKSKQELIQELFG